MAVKQRLSVYLDAEMMARLEKLAAKERTAKSAIAEAAIISFLTADDADLWEAALTAAQAKGRQRYESFIAALGRRLAKGQRLSREGRMKRPQFRLAQMNPLLSFKGVNVRPPPCNARATNGYRTVLLNPMMTSIVDATRGEIWFINPCDWGRSTS